MTPTSNRCGATRKNNRLCHNWTPLSRNRTVGTGGAGIAKPLGARNRIFFDARFEYGFINIQKYKEDGKNNTGNVLLSLGYACRL
jgi:hypothetical protein